MRTHHWLTAFLSGMVMLGAATQASAQYPPPGATGQASYTSVGYDGIPAGYYQPYPTISPFDNVFDQTYEQDGLWMRNAHNNPYKHRLSVNALFAIVRKGGGKMIGEPNAASQIFFSDGEFAIDNDINGEAGTPSPEALEFDDGRSPFSPRDTDIMSQGTGQGLQVIYGIDTPDGQTLEFSGFGMFSATGSATFGKPMRTVGDIDDPLSDEIAFRNIILGDTTFDDPFFTPNGGPENQPTYFIDLNVVNGWMPGVPLYDGTPDGTLMRVDTYYHTFLNTKAYGAGFTWAQTPYTQFGPFSVQTSIGARYIQIKEHFGFRGQDSGLDYEIEFDPAEPEYGQVIDFEVNPFILPSFTSLDSFSNVDMAGPELGIRYNAGGDDFQLFGETKFGVMGAQERLQVNAKGLGQQYLIDQIDDFDGSAVNPDPNRNPFYDNDARSVRTLRNSYVTPTFQQTFNTRSKLLSVIPIVRNMAPFREANFTAGYTILMAFQVSRPDSSIEWNANTGYDPTDPDLAGLAPQPLIDRRLWFMQSFNLGVEWEY